MRYIDPYELFSIADPGQVDEEALRKLRRRLLAEFELSKDGFLDWRGQSVDKTAAMDLLEAMADAQTRQHYWGMRQVSGLVDYLASNNLRLINQVQFSHLLGQVDFHRFVSAFWATNFDQQLGKAMETADWQGAMILLRNSKYLHHDHIDEAFKSAVRKAQVGIVALENAALTQGPALLEFDITPYTQQGFVNAFNQYPPRFQYLRDAYGKALLAYACLSEYNALLLPKAIQAITAACDLGQNETQLVKCQGYKVRLFAQIDGARPDQPVPDSLVGKDKNAEGCINGLIGLVAVVLIAVVVRSCGGGFKSPTYDPSALGIEMYGNMRSETPPGPSSEKETPKPDFYSVMNRQTVSYEFGSSPCYDSRPETGWSPYDKIFGPPEPVDQGHKGDFMFYNKSRKDLVLLVEHGSPLEIVASYYVRAKSKLATQTLPAGPYTFRIYNGTIWCDDFAKYGAARIGGFAHGIDFIGNFKRAGLSNLAAAPELEDTIPQRGADAQKLIFEDGYLRHARKAVHDD